ncbi:hypothetical protein SAMN04488515_1791 [Cognatiyoonia koreensis]|uniref:Uncharacterized protein n=1 Tax=Cognatiyoonia koreensis TaxID=364200 RepID=A0A1I0QCA1_9RHOB|nr:hypothetical protein SAMN04488515_1791 [Cognatiyoonia koreensis]
MIQAFISRIAPMRAQSKREFAQIAAGSTFVCSDSENSCESELVGSGSSKLLSTFCQHRYPSPCRSAFTQSRPTSHLGWVFPDLATNRYMWFMWLELAGYFVNLSNGNTKHKGNIKCSRNPGSSRFSQRPASLAASRMTQNAHLSALALAALLAKQSATTTVSKARLVAQSSAHWLTTSQAAKTLQQLLAQFERRRGPSPAAFSI